MGFRNIMDTAGLGITLIAIPLYVKKHGFAFVLISVVVVVWRKHWGMLGGELAPRGQTAKQMEHFGRVVLFLSIPVTLLILNDAWQFVATDALYNSKAFAQKWYTLMVDFWLASILGVALYPVLGNRFLVSFLLSVTSIYGNTSKKNIYY